MRQLRKLLFLLSALSPAAALVYIYAGQWRSLQVSASIPIATARKGEFLILIPCRGELVAGRSAQVVAPNVQNLQIVWQAPPGEPLSEGAPAIRFDPSMVKQQLVEKEAAFRQADATLEQAVAEARIREEEDLRELSAANYAVERARMEVSKQSIVSAIQGESSRIDLGVAEDKLRKQEASNGMRRAADRAKVASLTRMRDQAAIEITIVKRRLERMELKAPLSGVIVYMPNYSQGWMNAKPFKVGDAVWPGSAVAEIPQLSSIEIKGKLEETDRGKIALGQKVRIHLDPLPEITFTGVLTSLSPLTEQNFDWPPTRNFRASARFENPDPRLRPGMNGRLDIVIGQIPDSVSVPSKATFTRQGKPVVYLARGNSYLQQDVKVLARNADEAAIDGIPAGATVALLEPELLNDRAKPTSGAAK